MINWKKKTSIFIGRFQPFHKGHKVLFLKTLKNSGQVAILIMDSHNVGIKNPLKFNEVKRIINLHLKKYKKKYIFIKIPTVKEVIYGRKVGFKIKKLVNKKTEHISSTQIRRNAKSKYGKKYNKSLSKINIPNLIKLEE
jgi:nicotinamide mononucleotide adenylyltransferase